MNGSGTRSRSLLVAPRAAARTSQGSDDEGPAVATRCTARKRRGRPLNSKTSVEQRRAQREAHRATIYKKARSGSLEVRPGRILPLDDALLISKGRRRRCLHGKSTWGMRAGRPRTRKGRPPPRGPAASLLRENAENSRKRKRGASRVPLTQVPLPRLPAPSPAQRAPGAGGALLSHRVAPAVPSALAGLTSGFGMGPGVPRPPWPPARGGRCGAGC